MAYKTNIGAYQTDVAGAAYKTNIGADQTDEAAPMGDAKTISRGLFTFHG